MCGLELHKVSTFSSWWALVFSCWPVSAHPLLQVVRVGTQDLLTNHSPYSIRILKNLPKYIQCISHWLHFLMPLAISPFYWWLLSDCGHKKLGNNVGEFFSIIRSKKEKDDYRYMTGTFPAHPTFTHSGNVFAL